MTKFGIFEEVGYWLRILGVGVGRNSVNHLQCGGCGHREHVDGENFAAWRELGDKFASLSNGELPKGEFVAYLLEVELPELKELQVAATLWTCACGESNPPNFSECWKCGEESEREPTESRDVEVEMRDQQPWEQGGGMF